jgi:hypothetical protein
LSALGPVLHQPTGTVLRQPAAPRLPSRPRRLIRARTALGTGVITPGPPHRTAGCTRRELLVRQLLRVDLPTAALRSAPGHYSRASAPHGWRLAVDRACWFRVGLAPCLMTSYVGRAAILAILTCCCSNTSRRRREVSGAQSPLLRLSRLLLRLLLLLLQQRSPVGEYKPRGFRYFPCQTELLK